jgi:hypothetical protein
MRFDMAVLVSSVALWEAGMILRQFLHTDPVAISYLFGCGGRAVSRSPDKATPEDDRCD